MAFKQVAWQIYRIAQEALTNVIKHAAADHIICRVDITETAITLYIRDNGQGFDVKSCETARHGLTNMCKRAEEALGGKFDVQSKPGEGTTVTVKVPRGAGMQPRLTEPIRVFLLEDHAGGQEALADLLSRTPEGDLIVVGGHDRNSSDLPKRVHETQADIVLADLVLMPGVPEAAARKRREAWGIHAIEALRRDCPPALKIVAYSNWAHLRNEALGAGANNFLSKATTAADIRQMLRYVMGRVPSPPNDPDNLGRITSLELFLGQRELIVRG